MNIYIMKNNNVYTVITFYKLQRMCTVPARGKHAEWVNQHSSFLHSLEPMAQVGR